MIINKFPSLSWRKIYFTTEQSIRGSQGEALATNIYYKFIQLK